MVRGDGDEGYRVVVLHFYQFLMLTTIILIVVVGRAFFKGYPRCNAAAVALLNTMVTYTTLFFYIPILRAFIPLYLCKYENSTIADAAGGYCWVPATDGFSPTVLFSSFTSFVMICLYVPIALITALNVFVEDSESGFLLRSHNARVDFIMLVCKTVLSITISVLMPMKVEFDPSSRRMERAILSLLFFAICALLSYALRATQPYFVKSVNALRFASWCGVSYAALIGAIVVGMGYDDRESIRSMVYGGVAVVVFLAYFMCTPSAVSAYVDSVLEHFFREYGK